MGGGTGTGAAPIIAQVARVDGHTDCGSSDEAFFLRGRRIKAAQAGMDALSLVCRFLDRDPE